MSLSTDDHFASLLASCDEAIASGDPARIEELLGDHPELADRLERGRRCIQMLQQLRPDSDSLDDLDTPAAEETVVAARIGADRAIPERFGHFQILRRLGSGGSGIVFLARDRHLKRLVALKIPRPEFLITDELRERSKQEARLAGSLDHPNLVPVYEGGEIGPVCYIASAYCPGPTLAEWLNQRHDLPTPHGAARFVIELASGVQSAHSRGVLHRDLKPGNVLLTRDDSDGRAEDGLIDECDPASFDQLRQLPLNDLQPRITDFGLARMIDGDGSQTRSGIILGTPRYMSPEQAAGRRDVTTAADIYALGTILYELLTGHAPFVCESDFETLQQIRNSEPIAPTRLTRIPRDLETICLKCLEKRPEHRYPSASALSADLNRFLVGEPISARPTRATERLAKWARRSPAVAALCAAVVVVALVGVAGIVWQWRRAEQRGHEAASALNDAIEARASERELRDRVEDNLYYHRVNLAHREWLDINLARSAELLEECDVRRRGWEWSYLDSLIHGERLSLEAHRQEVRSLAYSPDGRLFASCGGFWGRSEAGEVIVWNAESGEPVWVFTDHRSPVMGVAFHPNGQWLASTSIGGSVSGFIAIHDVTTGERIHRIESQSYSVAFDPTSNMLAAGGLDGNVELWDVTTAQQVDSLSGHKGNIFSTAWSSDGVILATGSRDGSVLVWNAQSRKLLHRLSGLNDVRSVAFSPHAYTLAAATWSGSVKLWDIARGAQLVAEHQAIATPVIDIAFSPDAQYLAVSGGDGSVCIWEATSGRQKRLIRAHGAEVTAVVFSPDGTALVSGAMDRVVKVWDVTRANRPETFHAHSAHVADIAFSPVENFLACAGGFNFGSPGRGERTIRGWDLATRSSPRTFRGHRDWLLCLDINVEGDRIASGAGDTLVNVWDADTCELLVSCKGHDGSVSDVTFRPSSRQVASASADQTIKLWNVDTGDLILTLAANEAAVSSLAFSPDGFVLASGSVDGTVTLWDPVEGTKEFTANGHAGGVNAVVFHPHRPLLVTAGEDGLIRVWRLANGRAEHDAKDPADLGRDLTLLPYADLRGHTQSVLDLDFSPDGQRLASVSDDKTLTLWNVDAAQQALTLRLEDRASTPRCVSFSPDGRRLACAQSGNLWIWSAFPAGTAVAGRRDTFAWHDQEARQSEASRNWFGAVFHLERLLAAQKELDETDAHAVLLRRALAHGRLADWRPAAIDYTTIARELVDAERLNERLNYDVGIGCTWVARGLFETGYADAAVDLARRGVELLTRLVTAGTAKPAYLDSLARAHRELGHALRNAGEHQAAEAAYAPAVEIWDDLLEEVDRARYRVALANTRVNLCVALRSLGRTEEAIPICQHAIQTLRELVAGSPDTLTYRSELARAQSYHGTLLRSSEQFDAAAEVHREALEIRREIVDQAPENQAYTDELTQSYQELAHVLAKTERANEAMDLLKQAIRLQGEPDEQLGASTSRRVRLSSLHSDFASLLIDEGRTIEGLDSLRNSVIVLKQLVADFPDVPRYRTRLARCRSQSRAAITGQAALLMTGHERIESPHIPFGEFADFTIEVWVDAAWQGRILSQGEAGDAECSIWMSVGDNRNALIGRAGWEVVGRNYASATPNLRQESRNHIALVYSGGEQIIFCNGVEAVRKETPRPGHFDTTRQFVIGASDPPSLQANGAGTLRAIRVSRVARYHGPFAPTKRLEPDDRTALLFDFERNTKWVDDREITDLSGRGNHGTVIAWWADSGVR